MKKIKINQYTPESFRISILRFIMKYGDGHITTKAVNWLKKTSLSSIQKNNGDLIHVIIDENKKILGILAISNFGLDQAIIVVHPQARQKGVANRLVTEALEDIDRYYVKVANDNVPSLKLCFSVGMQAFGLVKGPTGKPTFVLGMGKWDTDEWHHYNKKI